MAHDIAFEKYTLSNGLDVILHEEHSIPVVAVNIWYHVGSQNEDPDRTGFAHLFEHIMFKGSKHHHREYFLPLQEVGANINGSTSDDRTNYYENVPAEYLELALWLESDRMGFLLDALDQASFDTERDVVKNERRQSYENRPYGLAGWEIRKALFPPHHPYHWETIGSQEHLDAASIEDVKAFFRRFYAPNNASLAIAGDIDPAETRALVEKYFGDLPPATPVPRIERWVPQLDGEVRLTLEDRVQLPRLYFAWPGPPRFDPDEAPLDVLASILAEGRSSRLYRSLVYDRQVARDVSAHFSAMEIAGEIHLDATVAPGADLSEVERGVLAEVSRLKSESPNDEEIQRAVNRLEARHIRQLESVGGFGGRANLLNYYNVFTGDPAQINSDLDRYRAVTRADVQRVARQYLGPGRVRLLVSPQAQTAPAATELDRSVQPGAGRGRDFRPPMPRRLHLSSGLDLLVVQKREVPAIAAAVYMPGGALTDPADRPGLASMTTRLMTEGTQSRSSVDIADEGDFIAARLSVGAQRENFIASTEVLTRHWPRARELWSDVLLNPIFPEREVERVRRERLTDLRRLRDDADAIADRVATGLMHGRETPYGHPASGDEASVAAMTREALVEHHAHRFLGERPTLMVVGDVDADEVGRQLEEVFAPWPDSRPVSLREAGGAAATSHRPPDTPTIYLVDKPGAAQSVIAVGHLSVPRLHPDYLPLVVMNQAFGGQFTARLNMNLRDAKGYTYGYRSKFDWHAAHSAFWAGGSVHTAVTKAAVIETLKEFRDLAGERPFDEEEFDRARLGLIRGYPPTFETSGQVLSRLVDLVHYGLPDDYYAEQVERLRAVSLAEVHRVAAEHVHPNALSILVVGDRAEIEEGLKELNLPVVHLDYEGAPIN
ncbi:MAG: insulinase family protein [Chloroflexi bacterium]|nr:insulinase family protein [Chloroflexota bacterium]